MKRWTAALFALAIGLPSIGFLLAQEPFDESPKRLSPEDRIGKLEEEVSRLSHQVARLQTRLTTPDRNERPQADGSTKTKIFALQHARAAELAETLEDLFQTRSREGETVRIASDHRNNAIIVTAGQQQLDAIAAVLKEADRPTDTKELKIFSLENADAMETARIVENLFQPTRPGEGMLRLALDNRTNSVIIIAPPEQLKEIEALIQRLDEPENPPSENAKEASQEAVEEAAEESR